MAACLLTILLDDAVPVLAQTLASATQTGHRAGYLTPYRESLGTEIGDCRARGQITAELVVEPGDATAFASPLARRRSTTPAPAMRSGA